MSEDIRFEVYQSGSFVEYGFQRYKEEYKDNGFGRLTIWITYNAFNNINGDEEARIYDYTNSFTVFRGFLDSAGQFTEDGEVKVEIKGLGSEIAGDNISVDKSSTDNHSAFEETLSDVSSYTVTTAGTSVSIDRYLVNDDRRTAQGELARNYDYKIIYYPDYTVRYEPSGYRDSGETLNTDTGSSELKAYEKGISRKKITKVRIIAEDTSGNIINETASSGSGGKFIKKQIDYPITSTQASTMANNLLDTNLYSKAKVKTLWYKTKLVNQVVTLDDSSRGINEDFVVKRQITYYPERVSVLQLGLADDEDGIGEATERERELRNERSRLINSESYDVGTQDIDSTNTKSDLHKHDPADSGHPHQVPSTTSGKSGATSEFDSGSTTITTTGGSSTIATVLTLPADVTFATAVFKVQLGGFSDSISIQIYDDDNNITLIQTPLYDVDTSATGDMILTFAVPLYTVYLSDHSYSLFIYAVSGGSTIDVDFNVTVQTNHNHNIDLRDTDEGNANVDDDEKDPNVSGNTLQKLLDLANSNKTNR